MNSHFNISATLRKTQLFAPLDDAELQSIASRAILKSYPAGALLFSEGDACAGLYLIASGRVRIFKSSRTGREQVLSIEGPGASVAELPVFDGGNYPASASAVEDSELIFVSRADFRAACLETPELSLKVLQVVGRRLRRLVAIIEQLSFTTLRRRLISWLLEQARLNGRPGPRGTVFELGVTHQEIAAQIGTVRELVSRNMARLQAQGSIESNGREITIVDRAGLEEDLASDL
jgi:CRP-like cAMP-binding protein